MSDHSYMDKHFALADIETPTTTESTGNEQNQSKSTPVEEPKLDDNKIDPFKSSEEPTTARQDPASGGTDGKQQPGTEKKTEAPNQAGDIKLSDGTVVKAGAERRWYGEAQNLRTQLTHYTGEANKYKQKYEALETKYQAVKDATSQLGLEDPVQVKAAVELYRDLAKDPAGTLKILLEEVKALGHNVEGLSSTVDTAAIKRMIDESLGKNSSEQGTREQEQERINADAEAEANEFFNVHQDAKLHEPFIAALLDANPGQPLIEVYSNFKSQALASGFDWSKPLGPQIVARKTQLEAGNKTPMISGNGNPGGIVEQNLTQHEPTKVRVQEDSWDDAILAGMRENGINYSR